jgi:hypothetical protein
MNEAQISIATEAGGDKEKKRQEYILKFQALLLHKDEVPPKAVEDALPVGGKQERVRWEDPNYYLYKITDSFIQPIQSYLKEIRQKKLAAEIYDQTLNDYSNLLSGLLRDRRHLREDFAESDKSESETLAEQKLRWPEELYNLNLIILNTIRILRGQPPKEALQDGKFDVEM